MEELQSIREGVKRIFRRNGKPCPEYTVAEGPRYKTVCWEEGSTPLFPARENPKIRRIKGLDILGIPCAVTVYAVDGLSPDAQLLRELDICEWWLGGETVRAKRYACGTSAVVTAVLSNDATISLQLHSAPYGTAQSKRELFTTGGMASDRAVDTLLAHPALYVSSPQGTETYTDTDILLYGLSSDALDEAYCIYNTICSPGDAAARAERLDRIVDALMSEGSYSVSEVKA